MELKLLEDAIALLEEKTLSRAAQRRNVTQPAFSRRIRALENWTGAALLERRANKVVLSANLRDNEDEIRTLIERLTHLRSRLATQGSQTRVVVLATQHALASGVFPTLFGSLQKSMPDLSWRLRTLNRENCIALFVRGDADLLMCYEARGFPPLPFDKSIERRIWKYDMLVPVVGGALRDKIGPAGLLASDTPLVAYPSDSHFGRLVERSNLNEPFQQAGARTVIESAFSVGVLELVKAGTGLAWVPRSMCGNELASGALLSLESQYGSVPLNISLFGASDNIVVSQIMEDV